MRSIHFFAEALLNRSDIGFNGPTSDANLTSSVLNGIYFWAGTIAVIVIIVAGFYYVMSSGNATQVARAKNAILGACIGLVVVLAAFAVTSLVTGAF